MKIHIYLLLLFLTSLSLYAQKGGRLSGDLQASAKVYIPDSERIPDSLGLAFYDYLFSGTENWLTLNYSISGFNLGVRFDAFKNSDVINKTRATSAQGIGRWFISKRVDKLSFTVGYFYEQYGSGLTLRAYENRPLGIDQSIMGVNLKYDFSDKWALKAFTGRLKEQALSGTDGKVTNLYRPILKGASVDGFIEAGEQASFSPGASIVNRTIDNTTMTGLAATINGYADTSDRFIPKYNVFVGSVYNTLQYKNMSWFVEGAVKSEDVVADINNGGLLFNPAYGYALSSSLTYSQKGIGIILQARYLDNFDLRSSPNETQNRGLFHYLPSFTRQNSYRLAARYNAVAQSLGELAFQADIKYTPKKGRTFTGHFSRVNSLDELNAEQGSKKLYQEVYVDFLFKQKKQPWKLISGVQFVDYNQLVYEQKGNYVKTFTPFLDFVYKFSRRKSIKTEMSYMLTKRNSRLFGQDDKKPEKEQDLGDWFWLLAEYSIAPRWSVAVADLYNVPSKIHYPTVNVTYSKKVSRFALTYASQPEGIVCTGGVCRFEPAFNGIRFDLTTSF